MQHCAAISNHAVGHLQIGLVLQDAQSDEDHDALREGGQSDERLEDIRAELHWHFSDEHRCCAGEEVVAKPC